MRLLLAEPRGFCAGVERAVEIVERALVRFGSPVFVRRQIVHNRHVVARLERRGAVFVDEIADVPDGGVVIFSAHGVSPQVVADACARPLTVIDATCPLVSKVHQEVKRFKASDHALVLIGHRGHDEVIGTMGHAEGQITLVPDAATARSVALPPDKPAMVLTQTTLSVDDTTEIIAILRERFPQMRQPAASDICYATQNRQDAVKQLVERVELLLVVGSANSSNAQRLVEVAQRRSVPGYLIDGPEALDLGWLNGVETIGLTSAASTPERLVGEVIAAISDQVELEIEPVVVAEETTRFALPAIVAEISRA